MTKQPNQRSLVIVLACLLTFSVAGNVIAAGGLTEIDAFLNGRITVMLHGKLFEAFDPASGAKYMPITYEGRTYLPLRAVAEAVGLEVTWDPNTETAYLGEVGGEIDPNAIRWTPVTAAMGSHPDAYRTKARHAAELTLPNGTVFDYGFLASGGSVYEWIATDVQYRKFRAQFYFWSDNEEVRNTFEPTLKFIDENDVPIKEFTGTWGEVLEVEVDIADVQSLYVEADGNASIMGNPELGK